MPADEGTPRGRKSSKNSDAIRKAARSAAQPKRPVSESETQWWDRENADVPAAPGFDASRTLGEWLEGLVPAEAQGHFINAGKEFAAGLQVTVDHHLGRGGKETRGGPVRIEIE